MAKAFLGLGTNLGNKEENIQTAVNLLQERAGKITALSDRIETEPWGFQSKETFLNAAVAIETALSPRELLEVTQAIEREMGRTTKSNGTYEDRIIDIDILFYDQQVVKEKGLKIPHPLLQERLFVLTPLAEIAPDLEHPVLKKTIMQLLTEVEKTQ